MACPFGFERVRYLLNTSALYLSEAEMQQYIMEKEGASMRNN